MNQTHRKAVEDAARKRREYLRKKAVGSVLVVLAVLFCAPLAVLTFVGVFGFLNVRLRSEIILQAILLLVSSSLLIWVSRAAGRINTNINSLDYVPPVHEQIAALPAEEVLLRGSDQPTAAPDELLRAARTGTATDAEELLRAESTTT